MCCGVYWLHSVWNKAVKVVGVSAEAEMRTVRTQTVHLRGIGQQRTQTPLASVVVWDRLDHNVIRIDACLAMAQMRGHLVVSWNTPKGNPRRDNVHLDFRAAMSPRNRWIAVLLRSGPHPAVTERGRASVMLESLRMRVLASSQMVRMPSSVKEPTTHALPRPSALRSILRGWRAVRQSPSV